MKNTDFVILIDNVESMKESERFSKKLKHDLIGVDNSVKLEMCKSNKYLYNKYESCCILPDVFMSAMISILRGCLKMSDINYMDEMKKRYAGLGLNDFQMLQVSNAKLTPKNAGQLKDVSDRYKMDNSFSRLLMVTKKDTNWSTFEKLDYNKDGIPYIKFR